MLHLYVTDQRNVIQLRRCASAGELFFILILKQWVCKNYKCE